MQTGMLVLNTKGNQVLITTNDISKSSAVRNAQLDAKNLDPIQAQRFIKFADEYLKELKSKVFNASYDAITKYSKDERVFDGTKISVVDKKETYDYSACDDWVQLEIEIKRLTNLRKEREKLINAMINSDSQILCEFTGEILTKDNFKIKTPASCYFKVELPK